MLGTNADLSGLERVRTVQLDHAGRLWIGSRSGVVARYDAKLRRLERFTLAGKSAYVLFEDRSGTMWAGSDAGLERFDSHERAFVQQPLPTARPTLVRALLQDREGALWVGTIAGLVKLTATTFAPTLFRHEALEVALAAFRHDQRTTRRSRGRLWVGTTAGLALLDRESGSFDVYRNDAADPKSLPDDNIVSLFEDRDGLLWIGTKFGGLAKWNPRTWSFGHHPARPEQGFASRNVMAITEDRSRRLWIGTFDGGIAVMDRNSGTATSVRHRPSSPNSLSEDRVMVAAHRSPAARSGPARWAAA